MLATLLWDLISKLSHDRFDGIAPVALGLLNPTSFELFSLLSETISVLNQPCFLVIDALDESTEDWIMDSVGLRLISDLLRCQRSLRVLLLGRETSVRIALKTFSGLEITKNLVHDDIQKLVSDQILRLPSIKSDLRDHIQLGVTNNSGAMFLWVVMVFKELRRCYNAKEIKLALEHIPRDLESEYDRLFFQLLKRLPGGSGNSIGAFRTRRLFQLILGAMEPLSLDQLRHAYAASCSHESDWEEHMLSEEGIIDTVGDFVSISNERVYLGHASIGEYLTRELRFWPENSDISFLRSTPGEINSLLTTSCMNYLRVVAQDSLLPLSTGKYTEIFARCPFFSYALCRIAFHFFESKDHMPAEEMCNFVQSTAFGFYLDYWYQMEPECPGKRNSSNGAFSEIVRLAVWYDSVHASQGGFIRILQTELGRREATFGLTNHRTTLVEGFLEMWELMLGLDDLCSEASLNNHDVDETSVIDHKPPPDHSIYEAVLGFSAWLPPLVFLAAARAYDDHGSLSRFYDTAPGRCKKEIDGDKAFIKIVIAFIECSKDLGEEYIEHLLKDHLFFYLSIFAVYENHRYHSAKKQFID